MKISIFSFAENKLQLTVDNELCFCADLSDAIVCITDVDAFISWNHVFDDQTFVIILDNGSVLTKKKHRHIFCHSKACIFLKK